MKIRKLLAIWAAKAAGAGCKMMGRQGVTWAGKIALSQIADGQRFLRQDRTAAAQR